MKEYVPYEELGWGAIPVQRTSLHPAGSEVIQKNDQKAKLLWVYNKLRALHY